MPERSASRLNLSEATGPDRRDSQLVAGGAVGGILLALAAAVVMLRLHRLSEVPPGLHADEGAHGVDVLLVLQGEHAIFFPPRSPSGSDGREGMVVYAIQLWLFRQGPQNFFTVLLVNLWDHLLAFGFRGDPAWRRNFAAQPMLNPWEAFFFWSGLGISLWRWKKARHADYSYFG